MRKRLIHLTSFPKTFLRMLILFGILIIIIHSAIALLLPNIYDRYVQEDLDTELSELCDVISSLDSDSCNSYLENYAKRNGINIVALIGDTEHIYNGVNQQILPFDTLDGEIRIDNVSDVESIVMRTQNAFCKDRTPVRIQMIINTQFGQDAIRTTLLLLPWTSGLAVILAIVFAWIYALQLEREHQAQLEKSKNDFLRASSHDLKTPLAGLRILLENMQYNVGRYKDHTTYLGESIQIVDEITAMVTTILDASRIQQEAQQAPKEKIRIEEEMHAVLKKYELQIQSKELKLTIHIDKKAVLIMNRALLKQVLGNLIGNAVQYTAHGQAIRIDASVHQLSIYNDCTPLKKEELKRVFEPFYRPDHARTHATGGNGLGLYIVGQILDVNQIPYHFEALEDGMQFVIVLSR